MHACPPEMAESAQPEDGFWRTGYPAVQHMHINDQEGRKAAHTIQLRNAFVLRFGAHRKW